MKSDLDIRFPSPSLSQENASQRRTLPGRRLRRAGWLILFAVIVGAGVARWGGLLVISEDVLPGRVDAGVVLQGSILGEMARVGEAMELARRGTIDRVVLSVPKQSYWGQPIPPAARQYIENRYGSELAARVDFCETGPEINSTQQEAIALSLCIRAHGWHTVTIVTSDYHTRRAGIIWRRVLRQNRFTNQLFVHGVGDSEFRARGWWRDRLSAKTWFMESTKLIWTCAFGWREGKEASR